MMEFDPKRKCFQAIWIHCIGRDFEHLEKRFRMTLFGQQRLISSERENVLHALFFGYTASWRYRDGLDGVLLSAGDGLKLCVNTFSPRQEMFRASSFFAVHRNGLCDPRALEQESDVLVVDGVVDRNNESAALAFLRHKYNLDHLQPFQMGANSFGIRRPDNLDE